MADKYVALENGRLTTKSGTTVSTGAPDAGHIPALAADGKFDLSLFPTGIGADVVSLPASEAMAAGALGNVWNDAGTAKVRNSDATTAGKEANAFVLSAVTAGQSASVYSDGAITGLSGLVPGTRYYASTTPGQITATPPSASGNVVQYVGTAHTTTVLPFEPDAGVVLE
jgi:hypothetical protein